MPLIVVNTKNDVSSHPHCEHGPTILFQRCASDASYSRGRPFYACSACRDRKLCPFFQWADEAGKNTAAQQCLSYKHQRSGRQKELQTNHEKLFERYKHFVKLESGQQIFCKTCSQLLLPGETEHHVSHTLQHLDNSMLSKPSKVLPAQTNNRQKAQYHFAASTLEFLMKTVVKLGFKFLLCVGTPSLHEHIKSVPEKSGRITSVLLDIDSRYEQFYSPSEFFHFNMFNGYFFHGDVREQLLKDRMSLQTDVLVIVDPPFGARAELLSMTLEKLTDMWNSVHPSHEKTFVPVMWFFPYFMEKKVVQHVSNCSMLDYQVEYDNHSGKKLKRRGTAFNGPSSFVRIFTNLQARRFVLPAEEGYRYCSKCERWISSNNKHCVICKACPSKDGKQWKHCRECGICVKGSYIHCDVCNHCAQPTHDCATVPSTNCHVCGSSYHKKRDCPVVGNDKKRKLGKPKKLKNKKLKSTNSKKSAEVKSGEIKEISQSNKRNKKKLKKLKSKKLKKMKSEIPGV